MELQTERPLKRKRFGILMLAFLLIVASRTLPLRLACFAYYNEWEIVARLGYPAVYDLSFLAFSLLLIAHDPVGYGVRVGSIGTMWRRVLLFCGGPLIITAIVCSQISTPFSGGPITDWLISPIAQDLLFAGYLYRHLSEHFPGLVHDRLPIAKAILITAGFFALWHVPLLPMENVGAFIWFQLLYTFVGACLMGLVRQWTGSLVYGTLAHMAGNAIAHYS